MDIINNTNYIFIIDLDGTLIGDCVYQCEIYKIYLILNKLGIKIKINEILEEHYTEKSKLIRPYFTYFINKMREYFPNSYFYIYTASEKKWAEKEISIIEKNLNIKFDRPIFTRTHCSTVIKDDKMIYMKSIELIKLSYLSKTLTLQMLSSSNKPLLGLNQKVVFFENLTSSLCTKTSL